MIKEATVQDATLLNDLNKEVQELHHKLYPRIFKPSLDEDKSAFFANFIKKDESKIFIKYSESEDKPTAYVMYSEKAYPETIFTFQRESIYVHHIAVKNEFRCRGVGKELMDKVLEEAKKKKINCIELDYWSENLKASSFFEKHQFSVYNQKCWIQLDS